MVSPSEPNSDLTVPAHKKDPGAA
ncbi:MAG: hypothetical protein RLZZ58_21, partial [Pseudomonadota bacterium]